MPVLVDPGGVATGRLLVSANRLVGLSPREHRTYAWLRDHFTPVEAIGGGSWLVYDVSEEELARCCGELSAPLPEPAPGLWRLERGRPAAGGDGVEVLGLSALVDGWLGGGGFHRAARTHPPRTAPVAAWFAIEWEAPVTVTKLVAYPVMALAGRHARRFAATELRFESRGEDGGWRTLAGPLAVAAPRVEVDLPAPLRTRAVRLVVLRQRNHAGLDRPTGRFRAACLELAAYGPPP